MSIESAITTHLKTQFGLDSNLSGITVNVYPHIAPQNANYPFVVYSMLTSDTANFMSTPQADLKLTEQSFDLSIYSESVSTRALINRSMMDILHGYTGNIGTENLKIRSCFNTSISTFSETDLTGSDDQIFRSSLVFNFFYNWS